VELKGNDVKNRPISAIQAVKFWRDADRRTLPEKIF